jgi:hypothetical protein
MTMHSALSTLAVVGILALAHAMPAGAAPLTTVPARVSNEPAATLLLPYFEVQLPKKIGGKRPGITTLFTISNASATAVLAHVTLWSDLAVPVTNFNVYLTGYDTHTIDLLDVLNGHLPRTASDGQDPLDFFDENDPATKFDGISNQGEISQDINFASCTGQLPYPDPIPVESIEHLRASLTGKPSALFDNRCAGRDLGEKKPIARGFVTIDTVNNCTLRFPGEPGYFSPGGSGDATNQNVLWGQYYFLNPGRKVGHGDAMIHIQAAALDPETSAPGEYTFYSRLVNNLASDNRQPLATQFAGRFVNVPKHPVFPTGTSVIAWRDPKVNQGPFSCNVKPAWFPLAQQQIVVFDEQENPEIPVQPPIPPFPASDILPFQAATQSVKIGGPAFPVATASGWIFFDLNNALFINQPAEDPLAAQATVTMVLESKGKYTAAYRAVTLDSATNASHIFIPVN